MARIVKAYFMWFMYYAHIAFIFTRFSFIIIIIIVIISKGPVSFILYTLQFRILYLPVYSDFYPLSKLLSYDICGSHFISLCAPWQIYILMSETNDIYESSCHIIIHSDFIHSWTRGKWHFNLLCIYLLEKHMTFCTSLWITFTIPWKDHEWVPFISGSLEQHIFLSLYSVCLILFHSN